MSLASTSVTETDSDVTDNSFFTVTLSAAQGSDTTFSIAPTSTYATSPGDYTLGATSVTFTAGETSKNVALTIKGDAGPAEFDETVDFEFAAPAGFSPQTVTKTLTIVDNDPLALTVSHFYTGNGANWNRYVAASGAIRYFSRYLKADAGAFPPDAACTGGTDCVHGGEVKKVIVSNRTSCTGLSMTDSEDAFDWRCSGSSVPVFFYSVGFKKGRGLRHLIAPAGNAWKDLKVTLKSGVTTLAESALAKWWTNPVSPLNTANINDGGADPRLTLSGADTIYAVIENVTSRGITINADGVSLVVLPGATLSSTAALASEDCRLTAAGTDECFVRVRAKNYIWLEGAITHNAATIAIAADQESGLVMPKQIRTHGLSLRMTSGSSLGGFLSAGHNFVHSDGEIAGAGWGIVHFNGLNIVSHDMKVSTSSASASALHLVGVGSDRIVHNNWLKNPIGQGARVDGAFSIFSHSVIQDSGKGLKTDTGAVDSLITNSANEGLSESSGYAWGYHMTLTHNLGAGLVNMLGMTVHNLLSANNNVGASFADATGVYGMAAIDNATYEIKVENGAADIDFHDYLKLGRTVPACSYGTGTSGIGIINATCDPAAPSSFTLSSGIDGAGVFTGFTTDGTNPDGLSGASGVLFSNITDWFSFDHWRRAWAPLSGAAWPDASLRGPCTAGSCGIFDFTIAAGTHGLRNVNGTFVGGAPCPAITKGSNALLHKANEFGTEIPVLRGVAEFILDGVGDDNGICTSGENCYFVADAGANLREPWNFTQTCIYDPDGSSITGVTIYGE